MSTNQEISDSDIFLEPSVIVMKYSFKLSNGDPLYEKSPKNSRRDVESGERWRSVGWSWTSPVEIEHFIGVFQFYNGYSLRLIQSLKKEGRTFWFKLILILCLREQKHNKPNR